MNIRDIIHNQFKEDRVFAYDDKESLRYNQVIHSVATNSNNLVYLKAFHHIQFIKDYFSNILNGQSVVLISENATDSEIENIKETINNNLLEIPKSSTIIFTSGSTGTPKGIILSLENFYYSAKGTNEFYNINQDSNWATTLPLNHVGGLLILYRTLLAGARSRLVTPGLVDELVTDKTITHISMVQTILQRLITYTKKDLKHLECIILGGAKTSQNLIEEITSLGIKISNSYGQSESCAQVLATTPSLNPKDHQSVGKPLKYREVTIEDGLIIITGKTVSHGVIGEAKFNGLLKTSDLAHFDSDNNIIIDGRADDIFISGGENLSPIEIEKEIIENFKAIKSAQVFPLKNIQFGHICALATDGDVSKEELKSVLGKFKSPKAVFQVEDFDYFKSGIKIKRDLLSQFFSKFEELINYEIDFDYYANPSKPLLICLHGFMGDKRDFSFLVEEYKCHYQILNISLPGHGHSKFKIESWPQFSKVLDRVISKFSEVHVLGYSLGGRIALGLEADIKTLIIESSSLGIEESEKSKRLEKDKGLLKNIRNEQELSKFLDKWYEMPLFEGIKNSPLYNEMIAKKNFSSVNGWTKALDVFSVARQVNLSKINSNTHYIYGACDKKYKSLALSYEKLGARTYQIEDASHNTHQMNKNEYLETLKSILLK